MKFLICGMGSIGQRHVRLLRNIDPEIEITAYRNRKLELLINDDLSVEHDVPLGEHYNIKETDNLDEALNGEFDAVFVTNPISMHIDVALKSALKGHHLFIEKPLGSDRKEVGNLIKAVEEKNLVSFVGYQLRFHPALLFIKKSLEENKIGKVTAAQIHFGEWLPGMHKYEDYRLTHMARSDQGGGVVLSLSHEIDYAAWLFGWPTKIYALGGHLSNLEVDVEDTASILLTCPYNGNPTPVYVHVDFISRPPTRHCRIIGEKGCIYWDYYENIVHIENLEENYSIKESFPDFERNDMFKEELKHFIECLNQKKNTLIPISEGAKSLEVCLAVNESINKEKIITPHYL